MPSAAAIRRGNLAPARIGLNSETDMRQAMARGRAMCSAWADALDWATAIEPYSSQMICHYLNVNSLPRYRSCDVSERNCLHQSQPLQLHRDLANEFARKAPKDASNSIGAQESKAIAAGYRDLRIIR
jgi:hypothetical protein